MPGVLVIEMMGQSAALCIESVRDDRVVSVLLQAKNATFRSWVKPSERLETYAEISSIGERVARARVKTEREGTLTASADLVFAFMPRSEMGLPEVDPLLQDYMLGNSG